MLSLWPRTLYFIFQQKNGYPECITASSFDTETTSAAIINKTWTDIIGTRDTAKGPPSGSGSRKRRDTTSPIETWKNPGVRANYLVNRVVVCDSKSIKITILMSVFPETSCQGHVIRTPTSWQPLKNSAASSLLTISMLHNIATRPCNMNFWLVNFFFLFFHLLHLVPCM
jgi:hypothetical protein